MEIDVSKCKYYDNYSHKCYEQKSSCDGCNDCSFYNTCYYKQLQKYKKVIDEINEICSNSLSVKLLFKDRMDLAIFIRKRIKEVKEDNE